MNKNKLHTANLIAKNIKKFERNIKETKEALSLIENGHNPTTSFVFKDQYTGNKICSLKMPHHLTTFDVEQALKKLLEYLEAGLEAEKEEFENL